MARIARSLGRLRDQVDALWPERSKASDGWIGDSAHSARKSAHNPNSAGVVCALDLTAPQGHEVAERVRLAQDPRVRLVISNRRIASSYGHSDGPAWTWRPYSGSNPHTKHAHIEVANDPARYDDSSDWELQEGAMALTPHEEEVLKDLVKGLDEVGSDGWFGKFTVLHLRDHPKSGGATVNQVIAALKERL